MAVSLSIPPVTVYKAPFSNSRAGFEETARLHLCPLELISFSVSSRRRLKRPQHELPATATVVDSSE
jgi:hypothetical protein